VFWAYFASETAQVELESEPVQAPAAYPNHPHSTARDTTVGLTVAAPPWTMRRHNSASRRRRLATSA